MIVIVDYGVGNLNSVGNMFAKCGIEAKISSVHGEILEADKIVLPGVGAFDAAIKKIDEMGLREIIMESVMRGHHVLGICLGAQLLMESSEEGHERGLGLVKGCCKKFEANQISPLKIPHMGWSTVTFVRESVLWPRSEPSRFYFTHSYYLSPTNAESELAFAQYGKQFCCAVTKENVLGVQFHPEKSHRYGYQLFRNFATS